MRNFLILIGAMAGMLAVLLGLRWLNLLSHEAVVVGIGSGIGVAVAMALANRRRRKE